MPKARLKKFVPFCSALVFFLAVFLLTENYAAPSFQSCVSQNSNRQASEKSAEGATTIVRFIFAEAICSLRLVDRHNGFFAALAAFVIAAFTFTLWQSTDKLWRASKDQLEHAKAEALSVELKNKREETRLQEQIEILRRSAEASAEQARIAGAALTQLERPYVFIFGVKGIKQDSASQDFFVEYTVANYGKMPAIIESPHIGFDISDRAEPPMPPRVHDGHQLVASPILQAGEQRKQIRAYFPAEMVGPDINVKIETIRAADIEPNKILYGDGTEEELTTVFPSFNAPEGFDVFFRAVIRYRGPFTSGHETAALWLLNPGEFEFAVRGGDQDNYVK
jgi:hypothetical protein